MDYEKRLTRKLARLDADLAARREEVEGLQRSLLLERNKFQEEYLSEKRERDSKAATQEDRIRDYLTEVLYTKPKNQKVSKSEFELDTVLVSFVKPHESFRYNLAFKIDTGTSILQLRNSACKYWSVSPDNFILRTMANNKCQDENRVKECFKQGEIAQLRLEMKQQSDGPPLEEELKAIQPKRKKGGGRSKGGEPMYNAEGVDKIQKFGDNYSSQLKKMGGIYMLLKLREIKPSEHASKIKLRDIIVYSALVVLTFYVYIVRRPSGEAFWCHKGIEDYLLAPRPKDAFASTFSCVDVNDTDTCMKGFQDVKRLDEVWDWLNYTLPNTFWPKDQTLPQIATYNKLLGYFSVRVQRVKKPEGTEFCSINGDLVDKINSLSDTPLRCYAVRITEKTQDTADYPNMSSVWQNSTVIGDEVARGISDPGKWRSADYNRENHNVGWVEGKLQWYDASGYSMEYRMSLANVQQGISDYRDDLAFLRNESWIDLTLGSSLYLSPRTTSTTTCGQRTTSCLN